jgi:SAM-dependent methyltransferase
MPSSRVDHIPAVLGYVVKTKPQRVLDVGVGFGKWGYLFREYLEVWDGHLAWTHTIDGIEVFPEYIGKHQEAVYDHIIIGDALAVVPTLKHYDLIFMGDVIEHFTTDDALALLASCRTRARAVLVTTPATFVEQGDSFGNEHERHLSAWDSWAFIAAGLPAQDLGTFGGIHVILIKGEL